MCNKIKRGLHIVKDSIHKEDLRVKSVANNMFMNNMKQELTEVQEGREIYHQSR